MLCSKCRLLAPISSGLFEPKVVPYRPDQARYVHNCTTQKPPLVVPARFTVTCAKGHLDDFPWKDFVHQVSGSECKGTLSLYEVGASGEALDVEVKCEGCGARRRMGQAFGPNNRDVMPRCRGRRPHLRDFDPDGCDQDHVKPMLQGASNLWFPVLISALSVPEASDELGQLVKENWATLREGDEPRDPRRVPIDRAVEGLHEVHRRSIAGRDRQEARRRRGFGGRSRRSEVARVEGLSNPANAKEGRSFKLRTVVPPGLHAVL